MRVLFVDMNVPFPPTDGGKIVMYYTARAIADQGHAVGVAGLVQSGENCPRTMPGGVRVWGFEVDMRARKSAMLANLFSRTPYNYAKCQPAGFGAVVQSAADEFDPEVIQSESLHVGRFALAAARRRGVPVVLRAHNVDSLLMERFGQRQRNPLARLYAAIQAGRLRDCERRLLPAFDCRVAITSVDAAKLSSIAGGIRVDTIPAGVDTEYFSPSPREEEEGTLVSVALMRWLPNVVSTRWFLSEVLPSIASGYPGVKFYAVGREPPPEIKAYDDGESVAVTGFVEDIRPLVARSSVYVVPTRVGSGMRIKILEALAMGKAVVTTSVGCEGIDGLVDGKNIAIADTADAFARAVLGLLADRARRRELGESGRKLVEERYQWSSIARRFLEIYNGLPSRGTGQRAGEHV